MASCKKATASASSEDVLKRNLSVKSKRDFPEIVRSKIPESWDRNPPARGGEAAFVKSVLAQASIKPRASKRKGGSESVATPPAPLRTMLATLAERVDGDDYVLKSNGRVLRAIAYIETSSSFIRSRNDLNITHRYPDCRRWRK